MLRRFFKAAQGGASCKGSTAATVAGSRGVVDAAVLQRGLEPALNNAIIDSSSKLLSLAEGVCQSYAANIVTNASTIWRVVKVVITNNAQRVLEFLSNYTRAAKIVVAITLVGYLCKIAWEKLSELAEGPKAEAIALGEEVAKMFTDSNAVPSCMICPITHMPFVDPVVVPSGQTFEREALTEWIEANGTNPMTRTALDKDQLVPNLAMRDAVHAHQSQILSTANLKHDDVD